MKSKNTTTAIICICIVMAMASLTAAAFMLRQEPAQAAVQPEPYSLEGKRIFFLGSSVFYGTASNGYSFVDCLKEEDGVIISKDAIPGTTMCDEKADGCDSYITRIKKLPTTLALDAFVCRFTSNDARLSKPLGEISDSRELEDFDVHTVAGAVEYIICYAKETWDCPVIFITATKYDNETYGQMVELLLEIQQKWDIGVVDLWNDEEVNSISSEDHARYMADSVHPTREGYVEWLTPVIREYLISYLGSQNKK